MTKNIIMIALFLVIVAQAAVILHWEQYKRCYCPPPTIEVQKGHGETYTMTITGDMEFTVADSSVVKLRVIPADYY